MKDKLVYDGWLKVYKREVEGKEYDILKNFDAVSAVIINEYDEILLVKQFRPAFMKETFEIPAGSLDREGESLEDCLIRELEEETNIVITRDKIQKVIEYKPIMGFSNSTMTIYMAKIKKDMVQNINIQDDEVTEVIWMPFMEFETYINKGIINDSKTIISYYYLKSKS